MFIKKAIHYSLTKHTFSSSVHLLYSTESYLIIAEHWTSPPHWKRASKEISSYDPSSCEGPQKDDVPAIGKTRYSQPW
jgi:hypothetical protein